MNFRKRLRDEIEYRGIYIKELANEAQIPLRTLETYLGPRESIPSADIAVRIAKVLGVTVEYLVTGEDTGEENYGFSKYLPFKKLLDDLLILPESTIETIYTMVHAAAELEQQKKKKTSVG